MADNVTTEELETALNDLAESQGKSTVEYVQSQGYSTITELADAINGVQTQITAITEMDADNGVESLAERIAAIKKVLEGEDGTVEDIFKLIQENEAAIAAAKVDYDAKIDDAKTLLSNDISSLDKNLTSRIDTARDDLGNDITSASENASENLSDAVKELEKKIADVEAGSTEDLTAKIDELATSTTDNLATARVEVKEVTDANTASIEALSTGTADSFTAVSTTITELSDTTVANLETAKTELLEKIEATAAEVESGVLKASSMDLCKISDAFRVALGLEKGCDGDGDGEVV